MIFARYLQDGREGLRVGVDSTPYLLGNLKMVSFDMKNSAAVTQVHVHAG